MAGEFLDPAMQHGTALVMDLPNARDLRSESGTGNLFRIVNSNRPTPQ